jgi:ornithine cyclodeaminase/alanine dehydrogenase-like protein (mu-crystallin family)
MSPEAFPISRDLSYAYARPQEMQMALLIRAEDVSGTLTIEDAIEAVAAGFREWGKNPELNAPRRRITTPEGVRVSVHPGGIPSLGAIGLLTHAEHVAVAKDVQTYHNMGGPVTVLFDVRNAALLAIIIGRIGVRELEAERPTPLRTAATSAVGTRVLARGGARTLGILGAGGEAKYHLLAFSKIRSFDSVRVYCRTEATRLEFCRLMERWIPCAIRPAGSAREVVEHADVLLTATNSNVPVFDGQWLQPGTHVTSIMGGNVGLVRAGIAQARRRELDDITIRRADVIVVNSREQAIQDEQGDLFDPVRQGLLTWDRVGELGALLNGTTAGRTSAEQLTLFKNNAGQGIADVAIASRIYALAREQGIGSEF